MTDAAASAHPFPPLAIAGYAEISPFGEACDQASFKQHGIECPPEIGRAVARRRREYLHGRLCARAAIFAATGWHDACVAIGPDRRPIFPAPLRGSITHTANFAAAACVAEGSIGIDAEPLMGDDLAGQIGPLVATEWELAAARAMGPNPSLRLTAIYSAKESLFKALSCFVPEISEFHEAEWLDFDQAAGRFTLGLSHRITAPWGGRRVEGQLALREGLILTAVLIRPFAASSGMNGPSS